MRRRDRGGARPRRAVRRTQRSVDRAFQGVGIDKTAKHTLDAMKRIAAAAQKNNLVAGAFAGTADVIKTYAAMGFTFMAAATDVGLLQAGAERLMKAVKGV